MAMNTSLKKKCICVNKNNNGIYIALIHRCSKRFQSISRLLQVTLSNANEHLVIVPSFSPLETYLVACTQTLFYYYYYYYFLVLLEKIGEHARERVAGERIPPFLPRCAGGQ